MCVFEARERDILGLSINLDIISMRLPCVFYQQKRKEGKTFSKEEDNNTKHCSTHKKSQAVQLSTALSYRKCPGTLEDKCRNRTHAPGEERQQSPALSTSCTSTILKDQHRPTTTQ